MSKKVVNSSKEPKKKFIPALSPLARENQLISLATDLVEERLREGTATSQETTHFLKLGSTKNQLEIEKLKLENELIKAKTEAIKSMENSEKMMKEAMDAFKRYSGYRGEVEE